MYEKIFNDDFDEPECEHCKDKMFGCTCMITCPKCEELIDDCKCQKKDEDENHV